MGRIVTSGFETGSNSLEPFFLTGTAPTIQTTTTHSGLYSGQTITFTSTASVGWGYQFSSSAVAADLYIRGYLFISSLPTNTGTIMGVSATASFPFLVGGTIYIALTSTATLQLFSGSTQVGSDSAALTTGAWHLIEMHYNSVPASGSRVLEGRVDGAVFATASNLALATAPTILAIAWGVNLGGASFNSGGILIWDDLAVNNSTGTGQTSYPTDGNSSFGNYGPYERVGDGMSRSEVAN